MIGARSSLRVSLLTSAAGLCLAMAPAAHAEINDPTGTVTDPEASSTVAPDSQRISVADGRRFTDVVREPQDNRRVFTDSSVVAPQTDRMYINAVEPEPQIVIANPPAAPGQTPNTTVTDRDPVNITGVGQMIVDTQDGFIGLCTGTLINPRTVIFAAHCVNEEDATLYGNKSGGRPIAFGFSNSNNTAGNSAFGHYLSTGNTNTADFLYNVNQVRYNTISTTTDCAGFLCGDIALASFDTPTKNIPTWALLFSALPARDLGAAGTGYHVVIEGYGNNGVASTGSIGGIDYRRRLAENMLGGLASLDTFENYLFGGASTTNPQNLYWIDFDDPRRGTAGADPRDFNPWRDNAVPGTATRPSQEGMTASGDSGGPLILDNTYAKKVVIGVLSGGYTRFYNGAPANGYGTAGFYQPLYLYWDWIAANNPYHYVSSVAGNGNWTDPTHWVTNIDPNYQIVSGGVLVNGVPTTTGAGNTTQPEFGEICVQGPSLEFPGNTSLCYNTANGQETFDPTGHPIGTGGAGSVTNDRGNALVGAVVDGGASSQAIGNGGDSSDQGSQGSQSPAAVTPPATLANGLPGATNFVPNNVDPVRLTGAIGKYFDVTLTATGTTTLNSAVTIDRFAIGIGGGGAVLDVTSTGSLTSLIDITQATGTMSVNGAVSTPGDYLMVSGGLNGTGTVTAAFFTSVAGTIAPGSTGAAANFGTLTFRGNLVLSSGNTYLLDLGANSTSDRIAVTANGTGTGLANLGGRLVFNTNAATLRAGNTYTILTAAGISGAFQTPTAMSGILTPKLTYSATAVTLTIQAGLYGNIIPQSDPVAFSYAMLLDRNRVQAANFDLLYGPLDQQSTATIRATLDGLRPATETVVQSLGIVGVDNMASFVGDRVAQLDPGSNGGTFARYGSPNQVAAVGMASRSAAGLSGMGFDPEVRNDSRMPLVTEGALPEGVNAYVAGGYLKGDSAPMIGVAGRDDYDGWYVAGGIETLTDTTGIGFAFSYTSLDGTGAFPGTTARASLYQGSLYSKVEMNNGVVLDASVTAGLLDGSTRRNVSFVGTPYSLRSNSGSLIFVSELGLGTDFDIGALKVTPRVAYRGTHIGFSRTAETGGPMALMINRAPINSIQGRAGITFQGTGAKVRPFFNGSYVHEFQDRPGVMSANFVGGVGGNVLFDLNSDDKDYFEVSGGLSVTAGSVDLSISAQTTLDRQDISGQAYRGSLSFRF